MKLIAASACTVLIASLAGCGTEQSQSPPTQPTTTARSEAAQPRSTPSDSVKTKPPKHLPSRNAASEQAKLGETLIFANGIQITVEFVKFFELSEDAFAFDAKPGDSAGLFKITLFNGSRTDFDGSVAGISKIDQGAGKEVLVVYDEKVGAKGERFGTVEPNQHAQIMDGRLLSKNAGETSIEIFGDLPNMDTALDPGVIVDSPK